MSTPDFALLKLPSDSVWRRLNQTPWRDLLRGRITARWEITRATTAANLPPLAAQLVYTVARRTKLWPSEKLDVARELSGHFRDGLDAGKTAEQLVEDFGDVRQSVKLIRRARRRCRPLWWHIVHGATMAMLLLALVPVVWFFWNAIWFWTGRPKIIRDFIAEINASAQTVTPNDRAWPLYREAALALPGDTKTEMGLDQALKYRCQPGDPDWQRMLDYLRDHQESLRLAREGARRPRFGFVFGDPDDTEFMRKVVQRDSILPKTDECLIQTLLPHLQQLRGLAMLLDCDARRATAENDATSLRQDLHAMFSLANHVWDANSFLVGDLISLAFYSLALERMGQALAEQPALLSDTDLRDFSHIIASFAGGGDIRPRLGRERNTMLDVIQRMYTDDEQGDGHLTAEGHRLLLGYMPLQLLLENKVQHVPWFEQHLVGPAAYGLIAGRAEMTSFAMRLFDRTEVEQRGLLYQWKPSSVDQEIKQVAGSGLQRIRYLPVMLLFPSVQPAAVAGERSCQMRDAILTALALELYHRRTGAWPNVLTDLTPGLLPTAPLDRYTGQPLGYSLVAGRPLLYSRGADGQDNGGTPPPGGDRQQANLSAGVMGDPRSPIPAAHGFDWVLWPPAPLPIRDDPE